MALIATAFFYVALIGANLIKAKHALVIPMLTPALTADTAWGGVEGVVLGVNH